MRKRITLAGIVTAGMFLGLSVAARATPSVDLRISQPGSLTGTHRFHGFAVFVPPSGWRVHRKAADEASVGRALSTQCLVSATVSSTSSVGNEAPATQLRRGLPQASEPGQPSPLPVHTVAAGLLARPAGAWRLVEPSSQARGFTLYGAAVREVRPAHWAGITVGFVASDGCTANQWRRVTPDLLDMLRTTRLHGASFG